MLQLVDKILDIICFEYMILAFSEIKEVSNMGIVLYEHGNRCIGKIGSSR